MTDAVPVTLSGSGSGSPSTPDGAITRAVNAIVLRVEPQMISLVIIVALIVCVWAWMAYQERIWRHEEVMRVLNACLPAHVSGTTRP